MAFRFEDLEIHKLAVEFCAAVYATTGRFPRREIFGLTANVRRAAVSIALNIAEGAGRGTRKGFARFIDLARGSLFETVAACRVAERLDFVPRAEVERLMDRAEVLSRKLSRFKAYLVETSQTRHPEPRAPSSKP